jgi:hypothetical protein
MKGYQSLSHTGYSEAQYNLGMMYRAGREMCYSSTANEERPLLK